MTGRGLVQTRVGRALVVIAVMAVVIAGQIGAAPKAAAVDVYTTPGTHVVNGRQWRTTCERYSSTVERCRTEIFASQLQMVSGSWRWVTGWKFNNLTYKPSPRAAWVGNPLATPGEHVVSGRRWKTECDTAVTGANACRSSIWSQVPIAVSNSPLKVTFVWQWVFNSVVRFTPGASTPAPVVSCPGAPLPDGMALTSTGMPYSVKTPYKPNTLYNPTTIANFIQLVGMDGRLTGAQRLCLVKLAARHLIAGSTLRDGARWFGYRFEYAAHPAFAPLRSPWYSGLAQGAMLGAFLEVYRVTGEKVWLQYGRETFQQFFVPIEKGGTTSRKTGRLWFEEYPTNPPTTVLNGHLEAIVGLDSWYKATGDARAAALRDEALDDLGPMLAASEIPAPGGMVSSYELVRGRTVASLRLVPNAGFVLKGATIRGQSVAIPVVARTAPAANVVTNGTFSAWTGTVPSGWSYVGDVRRLVKSGGAASFTTDGRGWQGLQQVIPASRLTPGRRHTLTLSGRVELPDGKPGESGRMVVYSRCGTTGVTGLLAETQVFRGTWATHDLSFVAPPAGCSVLFQLLTGDYRKAGTKVTVDNVEVRASDMLGRAVTPQWELYVWKSPTSTIALTGTGTATLEAYDEGRWRPISTVSLTGSTRQVTVPERLTGRNIHYGYHQLHVHELFSLYQRTSRQYLLDYARRWIPMAPSRNGLVPPAPISTYGRNTTKTTSDMAVPPPVIFGPFTGEETAPRR